MELETPTASSADARDAKAGDAAAFGRLLEPHVGPLLVWANRRGARVLGADFGAEDIVQLTLARAWQLLGDIDYRGSRAFRQWLISLADGFIKNRARYHLAKDRDKVIGIGSTSTNANAANTVAGDWTSVSERVMRQDEWGRVIRALDELSDEQRDVVERHWLEAESLQTIAEKLGISKNAVWERLRRGLDHLALRTRSRTERAP